MEMLILVAVIATIVVFFVRSSLARAARERRLADIESTLAALRSEQAALRALVLSLRGAGRAQPSEPATVEVELADLRASAATAAATPLVEDHPARLGATTAAAVPAEPRPMTPEAEPPGALASSRPQAEPPLERAPLLASTAPGSTEALHLDTRALAQVPTPSRVAEPLPRARRSSLEELLGARLFLQAGVAIVVLGVVFFLAYALAEMGPTGRVATGAALALAMLGAGLGAERRERWRAFGRSLVAGGWGILYSVAFAAHFVPAAQVIDSPATGLGLLLAVGAAAVVFSLRYRHELTTLSAFLLVFLALAVAAFQGLATFDLAGTTLAGVAVSLLAWGASWPRLLLAGNAAAWLTLALWVVPGALAPMAAGDAGLALAQIGVVWLATTLAICLARRPFASRWVDVALVANLAGAAPLSYVLVTAAAPDSLSWLALTFGVAYLAQAVLFRVRGPRPRFLVAATIAIAALGLVTPLRLGFAHHATPVLRLAGLEVLLAAGVFLRERYFRLLAYAGFALTLVQLLGAPAETLVILGVAVELRALSWSAAAAIALVDTLLLARPWRRWSAEWGDLEPVVAAHGFSAAAALLLCALGCVLVPEGLVAPAQGLLALAWLTVAARARRPDLLWQGAALALVTLMALLGETAGAGPTAAASSRIASWLATAAALHAAYAVLTTHRVAATPLAKPAFVVALGALGAATVSLVAFAFVELPREWTAPALAAMTAALTGIGLRARRRELFVAGIGCAALTGWATAFHGWSFFASAVDERGRLLPVVPTLVLLYLAHALLRRASRRGGAAFLEPLVSRELLAVVELAYLALPSAILAWLVKAMGLAHGKNLLVADAWALVGLAYLEIARARRAPDWLYHGHAFLGIALAHLFAVNFLQPGALGPISLRVLTVLPVLGAVSYAYWTWRGTADAAAPRLASWRPAYMYAAVAVVATLLLYELHRGWVVVAWAGLSMALVVRWLGNGDLHWRLAAAAMGLATVARGIGANLSQRDVLGDLRLDLVVLPLTAALLLASYWIVRGRELARARDLPAPADVVPAGGWRWLAWGRLWLGATVALLTAFVWVEAEGTLLTVFLSLEGLFLVGLGFLAQERLARSTGLALLTFCTLKLFLYDLRGLSGLPRILSFMVLGLVLIAVSYAYTRFRERMKELP